MTIEYHYEKEDPSTNGCCPVAYGQKVRVPKDLPKECQEYLIDYFKDKPLSEIRAASDFLSSLCYYIKEKSQENITMEDFEKAKKTNDQYTE